MLLARRYVAYARSINPRITPESKKAIVESYKKLRQADVGGSSQIAYRITVRQLESMIRLSEALARLHLEKEVKPMYVAEAYRLLQQSIIRVDSQDIVLRDEEDAELLRAAEEHEAAQAQKTVPGLAVPYGKYQRVQRLFAMYLRRLEDASGKSTWCRSCARGLAGCGLVLTLAPACVPRS